eukprot:2153977-Pyramimonas_sp.AAC.1
MVTRIWSSWRTELREEFSKSRMRRRCSGYDQELEFFLDAGATFIFVCTFSQPVMQHVADMFCGAGWHIAVEAKL